MALILHSYGAKLQDFINENDTVGVQLLSIVQTEQQIAFTFSEVPYVSWVIIVYLDGAVFFLVDQTCTKFFDNKRRAIFIYILTLGYIFNIKPGSPRLSSLHLSMV